MSKDPIDRTEANKRAVDYLVGILQTLPVVSERTLIRPAGDEVREIAEVVWATLAQQAGVIAMTQGELDNIASVGDSPMVIGQYTDWDYVNHCIRELKLENRNLERRVLDLEDEQDHEQRQSDGRT